MIITTGGNTGSDRNAPVVSGKASATIQALYRACKGHFDGPGESCSDVPETTLIRLCSSWMPDGLTPVSQSDLRASTLTLNGQPLDPGLGPHTAVGGPDGQEPFVVTCSHDNSAAGWGVTVGLPSQGSPLTYGTPYCASPSPATPCQDTAAGPVSHLSDSQLYGDKFEIQSPRLHVSAYVRRSSGDNGTIAAQLFQTVLSSLGADVTVGPDTSSATPAPSDDEPTPSLPVTDPSTPAADTPTPTTSIPPIRPSAKPCPAPSDIRAAVADYEHDPSIVSGGRVLGCAAGWAGVTADTYGNSVGFVLHKNAAKQWVVVDKTQACADPTAPRTAVEIVCTSG